MNHEYALEFKEYLAEYQLQKPAEAVAHYQDGELEAEWLVAAGFQQLTIPFEEGRELHTSELEPILVSLPKEHAEAINQRVRALNKTVRGRSRHRYRRKPDIRDVFKDVDNNGTPNRSRSATPDSLDSIPPGESWDNTPPKVSFDPSASIIDQEKQRLHRVPSEPLRGSEELFRGSNIRCDLPFFMPEGIELVGFQKIGTVHIPRVRSGSDPSCSIGRERGSIIAASRSDNNLLSDSPPDGSFLDAYPKNSPEKRVVFMTSQPLQYAEESSPISFENMCRQVNVEQMQWNEPNEPHIDINDISESDLKKFQQFSWLELASIFDRNHVVLDKRKPFKRKRKEEGNLFGVTLNALIRRDQQVTGEDSTMVPLVIQLILDELRRRGAKEEGILRLAGHKQKTEILYNELEATFYQSPDRAAHLLSQASVHDLSGLLKRLLRELPQPLLANDLIHLFYQTHSIKPPDQYRALSLLSLLLPHENRNTVRELLSFLNFIIDKQDVNKMTKHNVATIFAPSFFPPRFVHPVDINDIESQVKMAAACCDLTKVLISQADLLFMVPKRMLDQARTLKSGHHKKARDHERVHGSKMGNTGPTLGVRHLQIFILFWGMTVTYALRVNYSVAIVAMTDKNDANEEFEQFDWNEKDKSMILSSFFWGYIFTQLPGGHLAQRLGAKFFLFFGIFICSLLTVLTPWCASIGGWKMICGLRLIQGLCQGVLFPCTHSLLSKWAPSEERGVLNTLCYSGCQFGTVSMLAVSGVIATSSLGWPGIFYISGALGVLWSIVWLIFGASSPAEYKNITPEERKFIEDSLGHTEDAPKHYPAPWKKILTSLPFYSLFFVHCCHIWGFWTLLTQIPSYMNKILEMDIQSNALLSALPYTVMWLLSYVFCFTADILLRKEIITLGMSRRIFNTIGLGLPALALIGMGYMTKETTMLAIILLIVAVGLNSAIYLGYQVNHIDLAPNHAGTLMGLTNGFANIMGLLAPLAVGVIVTDETNASQWRTVFFISGGVYLVGNIVWCVLGSTDVQPWNAPKSVPNVKVRRESAFIEAMEAHG